MKKRKIALPQNQKKKKFHERELLTEHRHKRAVLWVAVGLSTSMIVIGWFANFKTSVTKNTTQKNEVKEVVSVFQEISNSFTSGIDDLREILGSASTQENRNTNQFVAPEEEEIKKIEAAVFPELTNFE